MLHCAMSLVTGSTSVFGAVGQGCSPWCSWQACNETARDDYRRLSYYHGKRDHTSQEPHFREDCIQASARSLSPRCGSRRIKSWSYHFESSPTKEYIFTLQWLEWIGFVHYDDMYIPTNIPVVTPPLQHPNTRIDFHRLIIPLTLMEQSFVKS